MTTKHGPAQSVACRQYVARDTGLFCPRGHVK
jgi:hypothetical protein